MATFMERRRLLTAAVLGGAGLVGATALGSLAPEDAFAADDPPVGPDELDPNFVEGRVSAIEGSMLRVTGSDDRYHRIYVINGTSVWKLRPTTFDEIKVGDGLYARGVQLDDGSLAADAVWANIVNLTVHISRFGHDVIHLEHHGNPIVGHVVPGTTAAVHPDTATTTDLSGLGVGEHVQVIGAWRPDTNEIDIATIYAAG